MEIKTTEIKLKNGGSVPPAETSNNNVKSSSYPFEDCRTEVIKGDVFIEEETKILKGLIENFNEDRVTYNPSVNTNFDFIHQDSVVCDGTMMFIWERRDQLFYNLLAGNVIREEDLGKDNLDIAYQIGDVSIEIENNVETDKPFTMSKYTIKIPTKTIKL